jgi:hypothetical protein
LFENSWIYHHQSSEFLLVLKQQTLPSTWKLKEKKKYRKKHDVWIWRYIRLIVALLNAFSGRMMNRLSQFSLFDSMRTRRFCNVTFSGKRRASRCLGLALYEFLWRLQVYHVYINLLLQQNNSAECKRTRKFSQFWTNNRKRFKRCDDDDDSWLSIEYICHWLSSNH